MIRRWGNEHPQAAQVTLIALTEEMEARVNYLPIVPKSFNVAQLEFNKALALALPADTVDETISKNFSSPIQIEEIVWAKPTFRNIQKMQQWALINLQMKISLWCQMKGS